MCAAAALGAGASAPPASAATLRVTTPCVVFVRDYSDPAMQIVGSGFIPNALVTLSTTTTSEPTPKPLGSAPATLAGSFVTETGAATFNTKTTQDQRFTLIASDGIIKTSTTFRQVRLGYSRKPASSSPAAKVKHIARGFTSGKTVWAHFRHHHRTRATKRLGVAKGPCGIAKRKLRALPARSRLGKWRVVVDEHRTFDLDNRPQVRLTFLIKANLF